MKGCAGTMVFALAAVMSLSLAQLAAAAPEKDVWAPLEFLIGAWSGSGYGEPGEAMLGSTTFSYELDRKIIVRRNRAEYPPGPAEKVGRVHEDMLIIYPQLGEQQFNGIYFDNEGYVINYRIPFPSKPYSVVFDSEGPEKGPHFRLIYEMARDSSLLVEFRIAPPGGYLKTYTKGVLKRQK